MRSHFDGIAYYPTQDHSPPALPPPGPAHAAIVTVEDAAWFLSRSAGEPERGTVAMSNQAAMADLYRTAARKLHPDAGGDGEGWAKLQAAKTLLDHHHDHRGQSGMPA